MRVSGRVTLAILSGLLATSPVLAEEASAEPRFFPVDREWQVLGPSATEAEQRLRFTEAGKLLGSWEIDLAGTPLSGKQLLAVGKTPATEPLLRAARETLRRPVDIGDFLFFLDDLLAAGKAGLRDRPVFVSPGRGRSLGFFIHPDEVFRENRPRIYPAGKEELFIDEPRDYTLLVPAGDGDGPGPRWAARYLPPEDEEALLRDLDAVNPSGTLARRLRSLIVQLRQQGADAFLESTVRFRERGYLMWGAFILSRAKSEAQVAKRIQKLERKKAEWGLKVPITWRHPEGWQATVEASRTMADTYQVVFATERGARNSQHYDGVALDLTAVGLPRKITLQAPDGAKREFDLSDPDETRDLSLSPQLIAWVEKHFGLVKLERDYPHWSDTEKAR